MNTTKVYVIAQDADRYIPQDPVLAGLFPQITAQPMFSVEGRGTRVSARPYKAADAAWQLLDGPLEKVRLPRSTYRWRVETDGGTTIESRVTSAT